LLRGACVRRLEALLVLDLHADGPDEAEQLATDGDGDLLPQLPLGQQASVARAQPVLRLPGDLLDLVIAPRRTLSPVESSLETIPLYPMSSLGRAKRDTLEPRHPLRRMLHLVQVVHAPRPLPIPA
jgi:hypothetical protein